MGFVTTAFAWSDFGVVEAEDSVSLAGVRDGTGVVAAKEAVAEAGDDAVAEFAQGAGD